MKTVTLQSVSFAMMKFADSKKMQSAFCNVALLLTDFSFRRAQVSPLSVKPTAMRAKPTPL